MTIIALTGMPAAGKGEVAAVAQQRGWAVHRIGDLVWEETERRGLELAPASGRGTIYSLSVTERPDHRRVVAYVTLEEGPTMMTRIIDAPQDIAIGDAVTVDFEASPDGLTVPVFRRT